MVNREALIQAADRCVLCALCSSHCPTYQLHREEGESPRGRVMLSAALLRGELQSEDVLEAHLNHCLLCRACEKACPSEVPYAEIIDHARSLLTKPRGITRGLEWIADKPHLIQGLSKAAKLWRKTGLPLPSIGAVAVDRLPQDTRPLNAHYPAVGNALGTVGLFLGCISRPFDLQTHHSAIQLLNQLGYNVSIPQQQQCCGALAQHHGSLQRAAELAHTNHTLFSEQKLEAVLFTSSGCGVQLQEQAPSHSPPYMEICDFILQSPTLNTLQLTPIRERIALHHPCSLRNALKGTAAVEQLLQQIPELDYCELGPNPNCCGAAGSHQIREPKTAAILRQPKLDALQQSGATLLISTNYGCALHLGEGVDQWQLAIEVLHPVTLLARQLITP